MNVLLIGAFVFALVAVNSNAQQQEQYCQLPPSADGRIYTVSRTDRPGFVPSGSFATVVCGVGFTVIDGAVTSYCVSGEWQADLGTCKNNRQTDCLQNINVPNGYILPTSTGTEFKIECNPGYTLSGQGFVMCYPDGSSSSPGRCVLPTTTPPPTTRAIQAVRRLLCYSSAVDNGVIAASSVATTEGVSRYGHAPGTTISLTCNKGYSLVGPSSAACRNDGYWSTAIGYCIVTPTTPSPPSTGNRGLIQSSPKPVQYCYVPQVPYGTISIISATPSNSPRTKQFHRILPNTVVVLSCDEGYAMSFGSGEAICRENGVFSAPLGDCIPITTTARTPITRPRPTVSLVINFASTTRRPTTLSPAELSRQLLQAVLLNNDADVRSLLNRGASVETADNVGNTVTIIAASNGSISILRQLLDRNPIVQAVNEAGTNALIQATINGQQEAVRLLLERGADANAKNSAGLTPLLIAASKGYSGIVALLLNFNADVTARDDQSASALTIAAKSGYIDVAILLILSDADLNVVDSQGQTPLMWAAKNGYSDIVQLLLNYRVDRTLKDLNGYTAEDLARANGQAAIATTILRGSK